MLLQYRFCMDNYKELLGSRYLSLIKTVCPNLCGDKRKHGGNQSECEIGNGKSTVALCCQMCREKLDL